MASNGSNKRGRDEDGDIDMIQEAKAPKFSDFQKRLKPLKFEKPEEEEKKSEAENAFADAIAELEPSDPDPFSWDKSE